MLLNIPEEMGEQLEQLAQQQGRSILDLLANWINSYQEAPPGSLAELAQNAREANLASAGEVDTAARSREILNTEYADYLKRRMESNDDPR